MAEYNAQLDRPFEHEARLKELVLKQSELNRALDLDKNERQIAPDDPQPQMDTAPVTFAQRMQRDRAAEMTL